MVIEQIAYRESGRFALSPAWSQLQNSVMDRPTPTITLPPREKLQQLGPASLTDAELIAIFLRTGTRGVPVLQLAENLIKQFGGLSALLKAGRDEHLETPGLGPAQQAQLAAILELARRHWEADLMRPDALTRPTDCKRYLRAALADASHEVFAALFLDNRHRPLSFDRLFFGTIDGASVHPRVLVKRALRLNAAAVIVAHNHPSGVREPSAADRAITRRLKEALALVDIRLLDHFIVGDGEPVSMAEMGMV